MCIIVTNIHYFNRDVECAYEFNGHYKYLGPTVIVKKPGIMYSWYIVPGTYVTVHCNILLNPINWHLSFVIIRHAT